MKKFTVDPEEIVKQLRDMSVSDQCDFLDKYLGRAPLGSMERFAILLFPSTVDFFDTVVRIRKRMPITQGE
jgi:hypothetical protein